MTKNLIFNFPGFLSKCFGINSSWFTHWSTTSKFTIKRWFNMERFYVWFITFKSWYIDQYTSYSHSSATTKWKSITNNWTVNEKEKKPIVCFSKFVFIRLGLLSEDIVVEKHSNPLDTLSNWLAKRLSYGPNERDIVILHHQVGVTWSAVSREASEMKTIDMVVYGDQKYSAMAKTVGLPAAIATRMLLERMSNF